MGLVGLLTRASPNQSCLPKVSKLHLSGLLALTLGAYSGGAVPDSRRFPKSPSTSGYKPCPAKSQGGQPVYGDSDVTRAEFRARDASHEGSIRESVFFSSELFRDLS